MGCLDEGAELLKTLEALCQQEGVRAGELRVMGALNAVKLVRFDAASRQYPVSFEHEGVVEIAQLGGQIALMAGSPLIRLDGLLSVDGPAGQQLVSGQLRQARAVACEFVLDIFEDISMSWSPDASTGRVLLGEIERVELEVVPGVRTPAPPSQPSAPAPAAARPAPAPKPVAAAPVAQAPTPAPVSKPEASSYYIQIEGKKYDRKLVELAREAVEGAGDGRISREDAELLLEEAIDGDRYTKIEQDTVQYLRQNFKWTNAADEWFEAQIRKWAAERGHIAPEAATSKLAEAAPPAATMSWDQAISASAEAAKPASQRAEEPSAEEIYSDFDDDFPDINPGDYLDHPKLGRCRVMKVEDDEYAHIRLPSGKISKLMLDLFDISYNGQDANRSVFKLRMRK